MLKKEQNTDEGVRRWRKEIKIKITKGIAWYVIKRCHL